MHDYYTLITGASRGIGKAYAMEFANKGRNLLLVASTKLNLEKTAYEIKSKFNIKIDTLAIDLSENDAPQKVYDWSQDNKYEVDILVNNAGIGGVAVFDEATLKYSDVRIMLNIRALVLLSRLFIPNLEKLPQAYILNTGSLSAYYPIPYKSVYAASKAFVLSFSKALKEELRDTPVSVSVVNPNGVYTNDQINDSIKSHGTIGRIVSITADDLAKITIKQMFKGKTVIVPKLSNKILLFIQKIIPYKLQQYILRKEFMKEISKS